MTQGGNQEGKKVVPVLYASQDEGLDHIMWGLKQTYNLSSSPKGIKMLGKCSCRRVAESFRQEGWKRWSNSIFSIMSLAIRPWPRLPHPARQTSQWLPSSSGGSSGSIHCYSMCLLRWSASHPKQHNHDKPVLSLPWVEFWSIWPCLPFTLSAS